MEDRGGVCNQNHQLWSILLKIGTLRNPFRRRRRKKKYFRIRVRLDRALKHGLVSFSYLNVSLDLMLISRVIVVVFSSSNSSNITAMKDNGCKAIDFIIVTEKEGEERANVR
uniref:Uncharacterized protein n=1 Tax=Anopheles aquasalis TaxID=42839 RepID=T1E8I3_ANOAQ